MVHVYGKAHNFKFSLYKIDISLLFIWQIIG